MLAVIEWSYHLAASAIAARLVRETFGSPFFHPMPQTGKARPGGSGGRDGVPDSYMLLDTRQQLIDVKRLLKKPIGLTLREYLASSPVG